MPRPAATRPTSCWRWRRWRSPAEGGVAGFVIATSDGGLVHLVHHLREAGHQVIVAGEAKTPRPLRHAAHRFELLAAPPAPQPASPPPIGHVETLVHEVIRKAGPEGLLLCILEAAVRKRHPSLRIATTVERAGSLGSPRPTDGHCSAATRGASGHGSGWPCRSVHGRRPAGGLPAGHRALPRPCGGRAAIAIASPAAYLGSHAPRREGACPR